MEDRIEINGVWYVKESILKNQTQKLPEMDFTHGMEKYLIYEDDNICLDARKDVTNETSDYIEVNFTNKNIKPWKEDTWDNKSFLRGIAIEDSESMESLRNETDAEDFTLPYIVGFMKEMSRLGWI